MLPRALSALLMLVLLWSGVSTHEAASLGSALADGTVVAVATPGGGGAEGGSVDDHHLDDQPSQAQDEVCAEPPELTAGGTMPEPRALQAAVPRAGNALRVMPPFIAGLQRPPAPAAA